MAVTEIRGSTTDIDEKTGEAVATVSWHCESLSEAKFDVPRTYDGYDLTSKRISPWDRVNGHYLAACQYRGTDNDDDQPSESTGTFEIVAEEREVPIENFPDRQWLIDEYGAFEDNGILKFPMRIPKRTGLGTGLQRSWVQSRGEGIDNPLFNARTYPEVYEVAVWTFFSKRVPVSLIRTAGTIIETLPAGFDGQGKNQYWRVEKPHRIKQGSGWRITWRARSLEGQPMLQALAEGLEEIAEAKG